MKVHYTASLWAGEKGACGVIQKTGWEFEHLGLKRYIPCIYHFRKGIVFDLLTFLDADKVKAYFEKYAELEDKLSHIERRCAMQEHPYQDMNISEIWIDGHKAEGFSSSAATSIPFAKENSELLLVQRAYSSVLGEGACFNCHRFCVPYPGKGPAIQRLLRALHLSRINTLKLVTDEQRRFHPVDLSFTLSEEESQKDTSFVHPVTGVKHHMYFQLDEIIELPQAIDKEQHLYSAAANYEIDPPLQQNDRLQFDSSISGTRKPMASFNAASSIGIIGGACGPTVILTADKGKGGVPYGSHGLPLNTCFYKITLEKPHTAQFVIQGLDTKAGDSMVFEFKK